MALSTFGTGRVWVSRLIFRRLSRTFRTRIVTSSIETRVLAAVTLWEAAALPLATITAWEGLIDRANAHTGQDVLIHAGAGGVGHVAVQVARAFGGNVFATVSPDKAFIVEGYGATPIDYRSKSVEEYTGMYTEG